MMREQYHHELAQMHVTDESKEAMVRSLLNNRQERAADQRPYLLRKGVVVAALAACLVVGAGASMVIVPVLQEHYGDSAGYQQSALRVGQSITKGGWTMTVTDCVWDDYNVDIGITLTAPEGTILDAKGGYYFETWGRTNLPQNIAGSSGYTQEEENSDENDNHLHFILDSDYCSDFIREGNESRMAGQSIEVAFGKLYHHTQWNKEKLAWEREYDCRENWAFQFVLPEEDHMIRLKPNTTVHTLDVDATLTHVEVSPFGVYLTIEGDTLKGHHSWVPRNAPDGYYGCIEYQEVVAWTKDDKAIPLTGGMNGSGCSGGEDTSEPGALQINRRFDELIDVETLDHLIVCGVEIPLT